MIYNVVDGLHLYFEDVFPGSIMLELASMNFTLPPLMG